VAGGARPLKGRQMSEPNAAVVSIGEVMIEVARGSAGEVAFGYGGDSFNVAVYLARAGIDVRYVSALGDDRYSDEILALAAAEGVRSDLVIRAPGRLPGLYLIETDAAGERQFYYWRDTSPARDLFELPDWERLAGGMRAARLVYFSGITLSLYSDLGLERFLAAVDRARQRGATVAFDSNFRPRGWKGDRSRARAVLTEALKRVDLALPTHDDEAALWGDSDPQATAARLLALGIAEIVVKNGPNSALLAVHGQIEAVPVPEVVTPVDSTAAGDSFNAAYIAARLAKAEPLAAAVAAHRLAGQVIRHRGAIMPRAAVR
jgi:2-dehydro-3-deoxygluconokinase